MLIGVKSSLDETQLKNKLAINPPLLEIHLWHKDIMDIEDTKRRIRAIAEEQPKMALMLHTPALNRDRSLCIDSSQEELERFLELCHCHERIIGGVMHTADKHGFYPLVAHRNREIFRKADDIWYYENLTSPVTRTVDAFLAFIAEYDIKKVTIDLSHCAAYNTFADMLRLFRELRRLNIPYYVHVGDNAFHSNNPISKNIGDGEIDFSQLVPFIDFGVIETKSIDEQQGVEMKQDYQRIMKLFGNKDAKTTKAATIVKGKKKMKAK